LAWGSCPHCSATAWRTINALSPGWETSKLNPYPWAILDYVAAKRGETPLAVAKARSIEQLFASNRSLVAINELGFYLLKPSVLAGQVDAGAPPSSPLGMPHSALVAIRHAAGCAGLCSLPDGCKSHD